MPKKIPKIQFLLLAFVLVMMAGLLWVRIEMFALKSENREVLSSRPERQLTQVILHGKILHVEVMTTPEQLTQGLSGREKLGSDGMLFILPSTDKPEFWMKEMQFALDMIWLRDGEVVEITPNVPFPSPGTKLSDLPFYSPSQTANMVLEVEAGKAQAWGIIPGARLEIK